MLTLYKAGNSICTQKVLMTLAEKSLKYDTVDINAFKNEQYNPEYLKINPKGVVPSLIDDGRIVIESTLICEYLDDIKPEPRLVPTDPHARARMRLWSKAIDEGLFEATRELSFSAMFRDRLKGMTEEQRQTRFRNVGDPERRARYESCYADGAESPYVLFGIADFEKTFRTMEKDLAAGGPWLLGRDYSLADINLIPFVARLHFLNLLDLWIADRPHVQSWWALAQTRPSYKSEILNALTETEIADMRASGTKIRARVGARRADYLANLAQGRQPALSGAA